MVGSPLALCTRHVVPGLEAKGWTELGKIKSGGEVAHSCPLYGTLKVFRQLTLPGLPHPGVVLVQGWDLGHYIRRETRVNARPAGMKYRG